ncbi:unnamed protein product [Calicophoron daubneyi]|uniref:C2 domain-containing protein n=1 Tax=Calicophoron daubneyi TaxID=300641 RepID=A0AAV2TRE5_CALDB
MAGAEKAEAGKSAYGLEVLVKSAVNLPNLSLTGKSDPFVLLSYQGQTRKTQVVENELNPTWNETLQFDLQGKPLDPADVLQVTVKDYHKLGVDQVMGKTEIPLKSLLGGSGEMPLKVSLKKSKNKDTGATVEVLIKYISPKQGADTQGGMGGTVLQAKTAEADASATAADAGAATSAVGAGVLGQAGTGGAGAPGAGGAGAPGAVAAAGTGGMKTGQPVYSDKVQDFQIRVKIVEARQLPGSNISPVCKVSCAELTKGTAVRNSTNTPYWNETFYFNFKKSPVDLFGKTLSFGVYQSNKLRKDAIIGSFQFELSLVYEMDKHSLLNKWLLLCNPDDVMAGAKGYLKVSVVILGAGDEPPSMEVTEDTEEDIEKNLFRIAGVQLRPALFRLRVYRAEDLPRMDPDTFKGVKNLLRSDGEGSDFVDPFLDAQFAGARLKTSTKYQSANPEWNEELVINYQFPSMCQSLKFTMWDWDRIGNNDAIATGRINIAQISSFAEDESGFLPNFGPCFMNLYGSPREYSELPDEYEALNLGKGEGAAYRGRVLMELRTELPDNRTVNEIKAIDADAVSTVQKYLRRRKFRLNVAFLSATQIPGDKDSTIEFEVSIGNYGNKLDDSVPPCASYTPPTNPVYDGVAYSYLPWGDEKPCAIVDCQWEDISFRLCTLNMLLRIRDRLQRHLNRINMAIKCQVPEEEQAQVAVQALDEFIVDCQQPLPTWEPEHSPENDLDKYIRRMREGQIKALLVEAMNVRENASKVQEVLDRLEYYKDTVTNMLAEPQNSFPDVIVWMFIGKERRAYCRIPANEVLYHPNKTYCGRLCNIPHSLLLKRLDSKESEKDVRPSARLRVVIWLGLEQYQSECYKLQTDAKLQIMAETYENQASLLNKWCTTRPPLTRPAWSDDSGKKELKKEMFEPPEGWQWDGDWFVHVDESTLYTRDTGQTSFTEEVYENQSRTPDTTWKPAEPPYSDAYGEPKPDPEHIALPDGWSWDGDWTIDKSTCCDEEGFAYAVDSTDDSFYPAEKLYHMFRRRRYLRKRDLGEPGQPVKQAVVGEIAGQKREERLSLLANLSPEPADNWEYAFNFASKFHDKKRALDAVRRRRWHRYMRPTQATASYVMELSSAQYGEQDEDKVVKKENLTVPRVFLHYEKSHDWHLRAYIFQARALLAADQSGMSDPYLQCAFQNLCQRTEMIQQTLSPNWDQTLIYESVEMYGRPEHILAHPPTVVIEIFDWNKLGKDKFLGCCEARPLVRLDQKAPWRVVLDWISIKKHKKEAGELLAAFELILLDGKSPPPPPPRRGELYAVPDDIRPQLQETGVEIVCWGVRNMQKYQLSDVASPSVEFEIGGCTCESQPIRNANKNPNFKNPLMFMRAKLPTDERYMPPLNICVKDHRCFGQKPVVGLCVLKDLWLFRFPPKSGTDIDAELPSLGDQGGLVMKSAPIEFAAAPTAALQASEKPPAKKKFMALEVVEQDIDWWSKYYASLGEYSKCLHYKELGYDTLKIYDTPLEEVPEFMSFNDFCRTFTLNRGKNVDSDENFAGEFKGFFYMYPLPEDPKEELPPKYVETLPWSNAPQEVVVRVYCVRAEGLQPMDPTGLADPYIEIIAGKTKVDSKKQYIPNTLNPEFGRCFEFKCMIPNDKDLTVRVKDYDVVGADDIIGETTIDLENRCLTKFRATCGIPQTYCVSGLNKWRDSQLPSAILETICQRHNWPAPTYTEPSETNQCMVVQVGPKRYSVRQFEHGTVHNPHLGPEKERLALHVLNLISLVKEHVEIRPLYNTMQPGIEQGRLSMWVDIFPVSLGAPGPVIDITPRVPADYVLRIVVWNTFNVVLQESNIFGERMSDIYVKGWLSGVEERQKTDVHYRSLNGEGNFNWRFVFPFKYLPAENVIVVKKKEHFWSLDKTETRIRPLLIMQVWDNDLFSPDDFLGTLELNLGNMVAPAKLEKSCTVNMVQSVGKDQKMVNMFDAKRQKGFWPFANEKDGKTVLTGKLEMEMEIVTKAEEALRPAGRAREDPNANPHLDPPKRPETSFLWITSPWKTFKFIIWKRCKWVFIGIIIAILLGLLIALFIYAIPKLLARKMIGV